MIFFELCLIGSTLFLVNHYGIPQYEILFVLITFFSGISYLLSIYWINQGRRYNLSRLTTVNQHFASYFPTFIFFLCLRSFVIEPFRIPSGSLKPTLVVGDFLIANKFIYGLRLPISGKQFFPIRTPKRGEIVAFRSPFDRSVYFIKRVVGLPGDRIRYTKKMLTINEQPIKQTVVQLERDEESKEQYHPVLRSKEDLLGYSHDIYTRLNFEISPEKIVEESVSSNTDNLSITVPKGHYFMMGDNRDSSYDSRHWGFVPHDALLGRATWIIFSWKQDSIWSRPLSWVRWHRLGKAII